MRASIAAAMSRSKREIPHYYLADEVILDTALAWLTEQNAGRPITERMLPAVLQLKAVALAAPEVRRVQRVLARRRHFEPAHGKSTSAWRFRCAAAAWWRRRSTTSPRSSWTN